jgi:hypothetical protein
MSVSSLGPFFRSLFSHSSRHVERNDQSAYDVAMRRPVRAGHIKPCREVIVDAIGEGLSAIDVVPIRQFIIRHVRHHLWRLRKHSHLDCAAPGRRRRPDHDDIVTQRLRQSSHQNLISQIETIRADHLVFAPDICSPSQITIHHGAGG